MTITVVIFSLIGALLVGLLGALIFIVVVVGFALLILLPVLFVTTFAAAFIWLWGVGGYYILKWFNKKEIPGINAPLPEGMSLEELAATKQDEGAGGGGEKTTGEKEEKGSENYMNGDAKHPSSTPSKPSTKTSDHKTHKDDDKKKNGNPIGNTVNKVPGGSKVTDTTKAVGVDINRDPTKDPTKVVDVGKVTSKGGDVGGKVGDVVGKVPGAGRAGDLGKVKGVAGGLLG